MKYGIHQIVSSVLILSASLPFSGTSATNCIPAPDGLVSWWRGENDASDFSSTNGGTMVGTATFGVGYVGQGFVFNANGDGVLIGNSTNLNSQNFTIECWIQRASDSMVSFSAAGSGVIYGYGFGGYALAMTASGALHLTTIGINSTTAGPPITNTLPHHISVTRSGAVVYVYIDGVAYRAPDYPGNFDFSTPAAIGMRADNLDNSFFGVIDELSVYNRALTAVEVRAIYEADLFGKCTSPTAPVFVIQPTNQTILAGESAAFFASALGDTPVTYQWAHAGTNIVGATNQALTISTAQIADAGEYALVATNPYGSTTSSPAMLTVNSPPPCFTPPTGMVSWWTGEGITSDTAGANHGTLVGNAGFVSGKVGQGFAFDGNGDAVRVGNQTSLQLQDITVEAWIKRTSTTQASLNFGGGVVFGTGGGYALGFFDDGHLYLSKPGEAFVSSSFQITDTNFHHVAWTKSGTNVVFYLDGTNFPAASFNSTFVFSSEIAIGARGDNFANSFLGVIDDLSVFNRALSPTEIQSIYAATLSGKCALTIPPVIGTHPLGTNAVAGTNVLFTVTAGGPLPLSYQWRFNNANIPTATNASLVVSNAQFANAGLYSVLVSNPWGTTPSSNAVLTVVFPNAVVRASNTNTMGGLPITVPITIVANGNENSLGFSLNFNTQRLAFASATLGGGAAGGTLFVNSSLLNTGRVGVVVALPFQTMFIPGTQEVARVTFSTFPLLGTATNTSTIGFADQPVLRELLDLQLSALPANFSNATVLIAPTVFEGDVSPRTNGNQTISAADWLQMGRFAARLDSFVSSNEFQRADCAPRNTHGDGQTKVTDWVQAGRFLAGYDSLPVVGGPIVESTPTPPASHVSRRLTAASVSASQSQTVTVPVTLEAVGDENAVGFTLFYNPASVSFSGISLGSGATGSTMIPNTNQTGLGKLGIAMSLGSGTTFAAGSREIVKATFQVAASSGSFPVTFTDGVVTRCVSDAQAAELGVTFQDGGINVGAGNPLPTLTIFHTGSNVILSWPSWAGDFSLQTSPALGGSTLGWSNAVGQLQTNEGEIRISRPASNSAQFFRLKR